MPEKTLLEPRDDLVGPFICEFHCTYYYYTILWLVFCTILIGFKYLNDYQDVKFHESYDPRQQATPKRDIKR